MIQCGSSVTGLDNGCTKQWEISNTVELIKDRIRPKL